MYTLGAFLLPILEIAALIVLGTVFGPKIGAGQKRMWIGLTLLILVSLLSPLFTLLIGAGMSMMTYATLNWIWGAVVRVLTVVGIALLLSAAVIAARSRGGYLDPSNPGAPPTGYAGYPAPGYPAPGYPAAGGPPAPGADASGTQSPYAPGAQPPR